MKYHKSQRVSFCLVVKKENIFPSISSRMWVLHYYSRVFWFIKRWERPLLKETHTGYSQVVWEHTKFKLIEIIPLNEQDSTKPCAGRVPCAELWVGSQPIWLVPHYLKEQSDFFSLALTSSRPKARNQSSQTPQLRENIRVCKIQVVLAANSSQT